MIQTPKPASTKSTSLRDLERPSRPKNPTRSQLMEIAAAERVVRKEIAALSRLKGRDVQTIAKEATAFLQAHQAFVAKTMLISVGAANAYVRVIARDLSIELHIRNPDIELFLSMWQELGVDELLSAVRRDKKAQQQDESAPPRAPARAPAEAQQITIPITIVMPSPQASDDKPVEMHILSMPGRESVSTTERDEQDRITRVKQTEKDA